MAISRQLRGRPAPLLIPGCASTNASQMRARAKRHAFAATRSRRAVLFLATKNDEQINPVIKPKAPKKTAIIQYGSCHRTKYPAMAASTVVTAGIAKVPDQKYVRRSSGLRCTPLTVPGFDPGTTQTHMALLTNAQLSSTRTGFAPERCAALRAVMAATYDSECNIQQAKHSTMWKSPGRLPSCDGNTDASLFSLSRQANSAVSRPASCGNSEPDYISRHLGTRTLHQQE
jgi:hypothetical protein